MKKIKDFLTMARVEAFNASQDKSVQAKLAKMRNFVMITVMAFAIASPVVFATGGGTASNVVKNLLGYIFGIFFWIGVLLLAWGVGQLVLAFKNEDGDSKSRAIMLILAAIVLMAVDTIFTNLGISEVSGATKQTNF